MAKRKRRAEREHTFQPLLDFIDLVDVAFERLTGEKVSTRVKELYSRPRELPSGKEPLKEAAPSEPGMPLADAYAVLGLKPGSPLEDVKKHYRNLANLFHPDKGGYTEAMRLLNQAYASIIREKEKR